MKNPLGSRLTHFLAVWFVFSIQLLAAPKAAHPLDAMTFQEYWTVLEVLRDAGRLDAETRFAIVHLKEPPKAGMWDWKPGDPFSREAYALLRRSPRAYEAVVDLVESRLVSWKELKDAQPNWLLEEDEILEDEIKKHPDFIRALKKRGITDLSFVECGAGPPGYFGTEEQKGRRIAHAHCRHATGVRNTATRRIENLTIVLDLDRRTVMRVVDEGVTPVPETVADYDRASLGDPRSVPSPIRVDQPLGPGFKVQGNVIEWQNWRFHLRTDQRVGMIFSIVSYRDGERRRPVLYQGYPSELFVPYMDPAFAWYHSNFLDLGEYSYGGVLKPLIPGVDCPDNAVYRDSLISEDNGRPKSRPNVICLFELEAGDMAWRHYKAADPESRRKRDLVVRAAAVVGNYDYVFDWVFQQDGSIRIRVGASGIVAVKAVPEEKANDQAGSLTSLHPAEAYGRFVDKNIVAVNHDHFFSFRLDLDVGGPDNSLMVDRLVTRELPPDHPCRSLWVRKPTLPGNESGARLNIDLRRPALWRVINPEITNRVGHAISYQLMAGKNASTLLSEDDYPRRRAGFIDHHLWVTPYRREERFAAGDHPTLSLPGQGLPKWSAADRPIRNTDIVLWYTVGMHHQVRTEDWPVMPILWYSFELRPFDFFDRNPAMDLPR